MDRNILYRFFAGIASSEEEKAVCDWVDASEKNREELLRERKYFDLLLFHPAKKNVLPRRRSLPRWMGETVKIAAAISVLAVSTLYSYNQMVQMASPVAVQMNKITVPAGQRVNLTLSDGTNVWVNACSELVYPASFTEKTRSVSIKGEAYFDVAKDEKHPFIVQTEQCDIKVLGTEFNVQTDESGNIFSAALLEGSIELTDKSNRNETVMLTPMTQAAWENGKMAIDSIRDLDAFRWKEGLICFENIRFADLMKRFEKTYDIRILIQNNALEDYQCSGKCRVSDGVDFILQVLQRSRPFTFSRNEDNTIIYIK